MHVEVIRGRSPAEVYGLALNVANRVAVALCKRYGCVLTEGKFVAGELAVEDPVAKLFGRYFTVSTPKRRVDHSWKVGELENLQKDAVIEYLQMPERLKKVEGRVDRLHVDLEELTGALRRFLGLESPAQPSPDQSRPDRYVT